MTKIPFFKELRKKCSTFVHHLHAIEIFIHIIFGIAGFELQRQQEIHGSHSMGQHGS